MKTIHHYFITLLLLTISLSASAQLFYPEVKGAKYAGMGSTIDIFGDYMAIGIENMNRVEIHKWNGSEYEIQQIINAPSPIGFGDKVTLSDDILVVQSSSKSPLEPDLGIALVYEKKSDGVWGFTQQLDVDEYTAVVAIDNEYIFIGKPSSGEIFSSGTVDIFEKNGSGEWTKSNLLPESPVSGHRFGWKISASNGILAVSELGFKSNGKRVGAVHLYDTSNGFSKLITLSPDELVENANFGSTIILEGDDLFVGATGVDEPLLSSGAVFVYKRSGSDWNFQEKLIPANPLASNSFGFRMAKSGDYLAVLGTRSAADSFGDAISVFKRDSNNAWSTIGVTSTGNNFDGFGLSFDLRDNFLFAGLPNVGSDQGLESGMFQAFDVSNSLSQVASILPQDGKAFGGYGRNVLLAEEMAIVSCPSCTTEETENGIVEAYHRTNDGLEKSQVLFADDTSDDLDFGYAFDYGNGTLAIGSPKGFNGDTQSEVYIYANEEGTFSEIQKLSTSDEDSESTIFFGDAIDIDGDLIAIGAPFYEGNTSTVGAVYLYEKVGGLYVEKQRITHPDQNVDFSRFGAKVQLQDEYLVATDPSFWPDGYYGATGRAYVFKRNASGTYQFLQELRPQGIFTAGFGISLDMSNSHIAIGSHNFDEFGYAEDAVSSVFLFEQQGDGSFDFEQTLISEDQPNGSEFGSSVEFHEDKLYVGSPTYGEHLQGVVFRYVKSGGSWVVEKVLTNDEVHQGDGFGSEFSVNGGVMLFSAINDMTPAGWSGSVGLVNTDAQAPAISCNSTSQVLLLTDNCQFTIPDLASLAMISDPLDPDPELIQSPVAGTLIDEFSESFTVMLKATNDAGLSASCAIVLNVKDEIAPVINCPDGPLSVEIEDCEAMIPDLREMISATENCGSFSTLQMPLPGTNITTCSTMEVVTFTVTDDSGNQEDCEILLNYVSNLSAEATSNVNVSCSGMNDGNGNVTALGGCAPYTYLWDNGEETEIAEQLSAGEHTVTITDALACEVVISVDVLVNEAIEVSFEIEVDSTSMATATVIGGTSPYTYLWGDPQMQTTETAVDLLAGEYMVTVVDAEGCSTIGAIGVSTTVSTGDMPWDEISVVLSPNPSPNWVRVESTIPMKALSVFSSSGQFLSNVQLNSKLFELDLSSNAEGMYFIHVDLADGRKVLRKILVLR